MNFLSLAKRKLLFHLKKKINIDKNFKPSSLDLESLFVHYGTDKATNWKANVKGHGYTKFYEKHLSNLKKEKINILEIGSFSGGSAAAFSKYFDNSKVYCLDINISNFKYFSKNIIVHGLDISNSKMIESFFKKYKIERNDQYFDIIIDDGSHKLSDILKAFRFFFKNLRKSGFYIIEDYKFPNYYDHLNDIDDIKVSELIKNIENKKIFESTIFTHHDQQFIFDKIDKISYYKGLQPNSDICFLRKC